MSWKTEHFRDPVHKDRAMALRNQGISPNPHKSWADSAKARKQADREAEKELDALGLWILATRERIKNIRAQADHDCLRIREGYRPDETIPF
jgi:hypothetical protein